MISASNMNRIIKFRAWDTEKKEMISGNQLVFWNGCIYRNESGTLNDPAKPHKPAQLKGYTICPVIMQFTGLLDKNGKEIYEGDVVRILYDGWGSQEPNKDGKYEYSLEEWMIKKSVTGVVVFEGDRWCLRFQGRNSDYTDSIFEGAHGRKEIIGNIYENKDLLK